MSRQWVLNLGLLVLVLLLGGIVLFKPGKTTNLATRVADIDREAIDTIAIRRPTGSTIVLQKTGPGWRLAEPLAARADTPVINNLLAASAIRSLKRLPYHAEQDAERYGFVNPRLTIEFNQQVFQFGDTSPLTRQQYLLHNGQLHLVSADLLWSIPRHREQFIDRRLLDNNETPVAIEFGEKQKLQLVNGSWQLVPANPELAADALVQMVNEWKFARALKVLPGHVEASTDKITIRYSDGKVIELRVIERESELILVRKDENLRYHFGSATIARLFPPAWPQAKK